MRKSELKTLFVGCMVLLMTAAEADAQRRTGSGSMQLGQRWATPGGGRNQTYSPVPGRRSSSPAWTLRAKPTYLNSRSVTPRYEASLSNRSRSYSTAPGRVQYSHHHHNSRRAYSVHPHVHIQYQNYGGYGSYGYGFGYGNPYDRLRILNGISPAYGVSYGGIYPSIIAPPIVIPYGGIQSSATYHYATPAMAAPAPSNVQTAPPAAPDNADAAATDNGSQAFSRALTADETPIVDEFGKAPLMTAGDVSAVDRIRSLRYQTSGDDAFRRKEYASASALYEAASKTAPGRRAPVLRSAWAQVAEKDFAAAAMSLKTALLMPDDPTSSWIDAESLYGRNGTADIALHNDALWNWLQQRPNSTDRLLLGAAAQKLRGYSGSSRELLQTATRAGLERKFQQALDEISVPAHQKDVAAQARRVEADDGLRMKGRENVPSGRTEPVPGLPEALPPDADIAPPEPGRGLDLQQVPTPDSLVIPEAP